MKATTTQAHAQADIRRAVQYYFALPILAVTITATLHEYLSVTFNADDDWLQKDGSICSSGFSCSANTNTSLPFVESDRATSLIIALIESKILLLGFPSQNELRHQVFESLLGAVCWGTCFLFIRKGCNPQSRRNFIQRFEKGTVIAFLSIFYGSMWRSIIKRSIVPLWIFGRFFDKTASGLFPSLFSSIDENEEHFICTSIYNAVMIGLCWSLGNVLIRRRLDPKMRDPPETFFQRHWKDVSCGATAMATSSLIKSFLKHYIQNDIVEEKLAVILKSIPVIGNAAMIHSVSSFAFDFHTEQQLVHHLYESIKVGLAWGFTSLFIRKGLNPDVRDGGRFILKYWRDSCFGAFAMACCVFLKIALRVWLAKVALLLRSRAKNMGMYFASDEL